MNVGFVFDIRIAARHPAIFQNGTLRDILGRGSSQLRPVVETISPRWAEMGSFGQRDPIFKNRAPQAFSRMPCPEPVEGLVLNSSKGPQPHFVKEPRRVARRARACLSINTGRAARQVYQWRNIFWEKRIGGSESTKIFFRGSHFSFWRRCASERALRSALTKAQRAGQDDLSSAIAPAPP
jgi:hypothetical protein